MLLLEAVNLILPKLGEHRVTRLDVKHPALGIILPEIENELRQLLMKGWWFNEFDITLCPDVAGGIALGTEVLSFTSNTPDTAVQRGNKLFNPVTLSYVFSAPVQGRIRQTVLFEDLPESAAQFVYHTALTISYMTDIGMAQDVQMWASKAQAAYSDLLAEHLRQKNYSTKSTQKYRNLRAAMRG